MNSAEWSRQRALVRIGELIKGKWRIEALVGIGGTAAVYAATHRNGLRAAIKILRPDLSAYKEVVTRFVREGYAANRVGHPGVAQVLDDDVAEDGASFLVMELLEGEPLENYARDPARLLPLPRALDVINQVLDVLAAAHAQGILHRDIKPANIFLTTDGRVKVLDFGIARLMQSTSESHTLAGAAIGTPSFMPPEQARGRWDEVDGRTDLWAVGAMAHAMLVGGRPRRAKTSQEELLLAMTTPLPPLQSVASYVPAPICRVFDTVLQFERDARYADARAMQHALRLAAAEAGVPLANLPSAQFAFGTSDMAAVVAQTTGSNVAAAVNQPGQASQPGQGGASGPSPSNPLAISSHVTGMTGQAVSMSHSAPAGTPRPRRFAPMAIGLGLALAVGVAGVFGFVRYKASRAAAIAAALEPTAPHGVSAPLAPPPPLPTTPTVPSADPTVQATAQIVPPPATSASASASPSASATVRKPVRPPTTPSTAKPFNPLDQRF